MSKSKLRVLVVDDDPDLAATLQDILASRGHDVTLAHDGESAIEMFRACPFDLCFMDVALPGANGVDAFLSIRRLCPDARVVMMTGYSVESLLARAVEAGALAVLHKPLDVREILAIVRRLGGRGVVLIVDDDRDFAETLRDALEETGHTVLLASDGASALEQVRSGAVDVLLLDLRLADASGADVFLALRAAGLSAPTIVVTGFAAEESDALEMLRRNAVKTVLAKPVDVAMLVRVVDGVRERTAGG